MLEIARRIARVVPYFIWTLLVLYPEPTLLARAVENGLAPRIDPEAVRALAARLPDDPAAIEWLVLNRHVAYATPWETHGVPWYFPTPREALEAGRGDCQARALVLASVLRAKGIPYRLEASFDHIWVWYPNKRPTSIENRAIAVLTQRDARRTFRVPDRWDYAESWRIEREYFWDAMPDERKLWIVGGWVMLLRGRRRRRAAYSQPFRRKYASIATAMSTIPPTIVKNGRRFSPPS